MTHLPPDLREPFTRFLDAARVRNRSAEEPEPDHLAREPDDHLIRLAHIVEPYARFVVHKRDARPGDLYVGRPSLWGNPFRLADPDDESARLACVHEYARHFAQRSGRQQLFMLGPIRRALRAGGRLVCFCSPRLCHAQVLAAWALGRRITLDDLGDAP